MSLLPSDVANGHATVLFIDADDDVMQPVKRWLRHTLPAAHITHCRSFADAQDYLGAAAVDLILASGVLPDATSLDVLRYVREHCIAAPVVVQAMVLPDGTHAALLDAGAVDVACTPEPADRIAHLRRVFGLAEDGDLPLAAASGEINHLRGLLRALCTEVGTVTHDINNPMTTISGNAQFVKELGGMMDLDPMIATAIEHIAEASQQLTNELDKLNRLKQHLRQHVGHEAALPN
ncbi:MAG: histidine kinase dimerization/phospho-acceptor domain-containing protein [Bacteroidota bacterium]